MSRQCSAGARRNGLSLFSDGRRPGRAIEGDWLFERRSGSFETDFIAEEYGGVRTNKTLFRAALISEEFSGYSHQRSRSAFVTPHSENNWSCMRRKSKMYQHSIGWNKGSSIRGGCNTIRNSASNAMDALITPNWWLRRQTWNSENPTSPSLLRKRRHSSFDVLSACVLLGYISYNQKIKWIVTGREKVQIQLTWLTVLAVLTEMRVILFFRYFHPIATIQLFDAYNTETIICVAIWPFFRSNHG